MKRMNLKKISRAGWKYLTKPEYRFLWRAAKGKYNDIPDREYLERLYAAQMGKLLDLENPKTFNEKLQWLKLNDRKPHYTQMVDKAAAKEYAAKLIDETHIVPTLGVWDRFDDIDFGRLPEQFVLKTTHGCGGMVICRDKNTLNRAEARRILEKALRREYFYHVREWPYKNVKPRILAETYLQAGDSLNLDVYKVFNFHGEPKLIQSIQNDKTSYETIDYFDTDWNRLDLRQNYPNSPNPRQKPVALEQMLELSRKCSQGFPFLRTDWYIVDGQIYFSEFTFYSDAGMEQFHPAKWDGILGDWIQLPTEKSVPDEESIDGSL